MEINLKMGALLIFCSLICALLGTFARWFPIKGLDGGFIKDYGLLIKAHIDYVLMAMLNFLIYVVAKAGDITFPVEACWLIAIGGFTNPTVFTIAMLKPDFWQFMWAKIYTAATFALSTIGFAWAGWVMLNV
ncbi:MAG: hypothetical protein LBV44_10230 [Methylobacillus sp.]|jgi:hypothetical protein|nr:hypothetical protein [Methylobacillus sp.]